MKSDSCLAVAPSLSRPFMSCKVQHCALQLLRSSSSSQAPPLQLFNSSSLRPCFQFQLHLSSSCLLLLRSISFLQLLLSSTFSPSPPLSHRHLSSPSSPAPASSSPLQLLLPAHPLLPLHFNSGPPVPLSPAPPIQTLPSAPLLQFLHTSPAHQLFLSAPSYQPQYNSSPRLHSSSLPASLPQLLLALLLLSLCSPTLASIPSAPSPPLQLLISNSDSPALHVQLFVSSSYRKLLLSSSHLHVILPLLQRLCSSSSTLAPPSFPHPLSRSN